MIRGKVFEGKWTTSSGKQVVVACSRAGHHLPWLGYLCTNPSIVLEWRDDGLESTRDELNLFMPIIDLPAGYKWAGTDLMTGNYGDLPEGSDVKVLSAGKWISNNQLGVPQPLKIGNWYCYKEPIKKEYIPDIEKEIELPAGYKYYEFKPSNMWADDESCGRVLCCPPWNCFYTDAMCLKGFHKFVYKCGKQSIRPLIQHKGQTIQPVGCLIKKDAQ